MPIIKRIFTCTLLATSSFYLSACVVDSCGTDGLGYTVGEVDAQVLMASGEVDNRQTDFPTLQLGVEREVPAGKLVLSIDAIEIALTRQQSPIIRLSLFAQAHACSPFPDVSHPTNLLKNITITSNQPFSDAYPAGSALNSLFEIRDLTGSKNEGFFWTPNQDTGLYEFQSLAEHLETKPYAAASTKLHLNYAMPEFATHEFTIEYELEDGLIWQISLPAITFVEK